MCFLLSLAVQLEDCMWSLAQYVRKERIPPNYRLRFLSLAVHIPNVKYYICPDRHNDEEEYFLSKSHSGLIQQIKGNNGIIAHCHSETAFFILTS